MSRILRRPMFRGGSVDGRGTGITSGLGYEKGGRVALEEGGAFLSTQAIIDLIQEGKSTPELFEMLINRGYGGVQKVGEMAYSFNPDYIDSEPNFYAEPQEPERNFYMQQPKFANGGIASLANGGMPGKRGLVDGPGGYAGVSTSEGFGRSPIYRFGERVMDYGVNPLLNAINQGIVNPITGLFGYGDLIPRMETPYDNKFVFGDEDFTDKYRKKYADTPIETDSGAIPKAIMENQDKISQEELLKKQLENLNKPKPKEDPVDPKASIEDNKELFAELLGSKKARGDDISQMLLSFAGKALKPEATVKSSFGEFFEDEAKRPSRKQKIDDNAAALAINQYIAGEKSKADLETILARTKFGVDYTATIKKAIENSKSFPTRLRETAGTTGKTTDKSVITAVLSEEDPPQVYAGDLPKDVESITAGVFYTRDRESGGKELIMFDSAGNVREELTRIIFR